MPGFIGPQSDPAAADAGLSGQRQKKDCERNAAKRWISKHASHLASCRPVLLGDDIDCCHPRCQLVLDHGADCLFVGQPASHKGLQDCLHESLYHSTGWLRVRHARTTSPATATAGRPACQCATAPTPAPGSNSPLLNPGLIRGIVGFLDRIISLRIGWESGRIWDGRESVEWISRIGSPRICSSY